VAIVTLVSLAMELVPTVLQERMVFAAKTLAYVPLEPPVLLMALALAVHLGTTIPNAPPHAPVHLERYAMTESTVTEPVPLHLQLSSLKLVPLLIHLQSLS